MLLSSLCHWLATVLLLLSCITSFVQGKGHAIQLLSFSADNKTFSLNKDVLKDVLLKDKSISESNVAVISIAGPFRKGKSFLLSFFLRYLDFMVPSCEEDDSDQTFTLTNQIYAWCKQRLTSGSSSWTGDEYVPLKGFEWQSGEERVTSGIQMWSKVFHSILPDGEKVAIILLDTQGLFDHRTSFAMNAKIYALSTMISSIQIYNLMQNVQDSDLQLLKFFTDYGSLSANVSGGSQKANFQKLLFLIRDWFNPHQFPYGSDGGRRYIEKVLSVSDGQPEELRTIRKQINNTFSEVDGFLMPFPGKEVASSPRFDGRLSDIDLDFRNSLEELVPLLLSSINLVPKEINGRRITVNEVIAYLSVYVEKLNAEENLAPKSIIQANSEISHELASEGALKFYASNMETISGISMAPVEQNELLSKHEESYEHASHLFEDYPKFGDDSYTSLYRKKLKEDTERLFQFYEKDNNNKKQILKMKQEIEELRKDSENEKIRQLESKIKELQAQRDHDWLYKLANLLIMPILGFFWTIRYLIDFLILNSSNIIVQKCVQIMHYSLESLFSF